MSTIPVKNVAPGRGPVALEVGVLAYGQTGDAPDTPYTAELLALGHLLRMPDEPTEVVETDSVKRDRLKREREAEANTNPPAGERE